jgi:hypothetical protein
MSRSTKELRSLWAPHCKGPWATVTLHGGGKVTVRASLVDAVKALNDILLDWDYHTRQAVTGGYNCRKITGGTGYSLHAYATAIDINWDTNPYGKWLRTDMPAGMTAQIKRIRTGNGAQVWRWGGDFAGNKDAMHFECVASPSEIATGIQRPGKPVPQPAPSDPAVARWAAGVQARAREVLPFVERMPNLNGSTPYSWHTVRLQQALNLVSGAGLVEDGLYGPGTIKAVLAFQKKSDIVKDFPGAAHENTRWWLAVALRALAA